MLKLTKEIKELIKQGAIFYVSHSGGKDSQAMYALIREAIPADQIEVVHADLGEVEWKGVQEHIKNNVDHEVHVVRAGKTFLEMVEKRGKFPSAAYRQCTSDLKRGPISKDDQIVASGTLHARSEAGAEGRIKNEVLHKHNSWEWVKIEQLYCSCGSDNDVTDFYDLQNNYYILCVDCRFKMYNCF